MSLIVLALDALDAGLVEEWEVESLKLENHKKIETFDYGKNQPFTIEVWPSIATGLHPEEHGVSEYSSGEWSSVFNPIFKLVSRFLPYSARKKIGSILESIGFEHSYEIPEIEEETFMDGDNRVVHNWPSVKNNEELREMWSVSKQEVYNVDRLNMLVFGKGAQQFGWAREMLNYELELAAVHIHTLDILGHAYSTPESEENPHDIENYSMENLRVAYERVGDFVEEIRDEMGEEDELLIISDHGMNNPILDNEKFGEHSYRAFASTTINEDLPESVMDYKDWIEENCPEVERKSSNVSMPKEQLRDLGYIE